MPFVLDPRRTTVRAFTSTEGLFARLAHDLEIAVRDVSGNAAVGPPGTANIRFAVAGIDVAGVVKKGVTDHNALAAWERKQIVGRIRDDVFPGSTELLIEVTLVEREALLDIVFPHARQSVRATVTLDRTDADVVVCGECAISLRAFGIGPLKGPLGAFVVADKVRITFEATFAET